MKSIGNFMLATSLLTLKNSQSGMPTMSFKRSILNILFAFTALVFLNSACSQNETNTDTYVVIPYYRGSVNDIVNLKVPSGYLDTYAMNGPKIIGAKEYSSEIFDALYLEMSASDYSPRRVNNKAAFTYPASLTQKISLRISSWYKKTEQSSTSTRRENSNLRERNFISSCTKPPRPRQKFGLEWYQFDKETCQQAGLIIDRLVLKDTEGNVITELHCNPLPMAVDVVKKINSVGQAINPMCEHIFFSKELNAVVTLNYSASRLENWREIEHQTSNILMSFIEETN